MWKKFKDWTYNKQQPAVTFKGLKVLIGNRLFNLRKARQSDVSNLLKIERELYDGLTPWDKSSFMREIGRSHGSLYLVLENTDEIVAFIGLNWNLDEAHITNLAVLSEYQEQKIGHWLLEYVIEYCKKLDVDRLTLEVDVENHVAIHLYHSLGFKNGRIKKFYYNFNNGDAMNMELLLRTEN